MQHRVLARLWCAVVAVVAVVAVGEAPSGAAISSSRQIVHVPTLVAPYGEPIQLTATGRCATETCSMSLAYRPADGLSGVGAVNYLLGSGPGFTVESMAAGAAQALPDGTFLRTFTGAIPESVLTTEGVDYRLRLDDGEAAVHFPGLDETLGDPVGGLVEAFTYVHVEVLSRPTVTHVPHASYAPGDVIAVEAAVTASTGTPSVTLTYGHSGGTGRWQVPMTLRTTAVDVDGVATAWVAQASIPSWFTSQGGTIAYTITLDDGHQVASSPPLDGTVTIGHLVLPQGLSL